MKINMLFRNESSFRPSLAGVVSVAIVFHTLLLVLPVRITFFVVNQRFFSMQFRKKLYIFIFLLLIISGYRITKN